MAAIRELLSNLINPTELLQGAAGDWFLIILLTCIYMATAGATLPKHLVQSRYGKTLITATGLLLAFGLYTARDQLRFNLESFGFLAVGLLAIIAFMVIFGLAKVGLFSNHKAASFALAYSIIYTSFAAITPSLYDMIAEFFPLLNGLLLLLFLACLGLLFYKAFASLIPGSKVKEAASSVQEHLKQPDQQNIQQEEQAEQHEYRDLTHTIKQIQKQETGSAEELNRQLNQLIHMLKGHQTLNQDDAKRITALLQEMAKHKNQFQNRLYQLKHAFDQEQNKDRSTIQDMERRLKETTDPRKQKAIKKELDYEKKKQEIFDFIKQNEKDIHTNLNAFQQQMGQASTLIQKNNTKKALACLQRAAKALGTIEKELSRLKHYEKELAAFDRKAFQKLHKEEQGRT